MDMFNCLYRLTQTKNLFHVPPFLFIQSLKGIHWLASMESQFNHVVNNFGVMKNLFCSSTGYQLYDLEQMTKFSKSLYKMGTII